jgi:uncharacterized protein (TIGR02722 family)
MKRGRGLGVAVIAGVLVLSAGCMGTKVRYGDATSAEPLNTDFGSSDLQQIAAAMVDSLLADPGVRAVTASRKPVLVVDRVKNKTLQHIDTESLTDSIRTKLIQSGKFSFIDRTTDQAALDEFNAQRESGLVDPAKALPLGTQSGAEYILTANLAEIAQKAGNKTDVYYKFTMNLKNLRTGILDWAAEKEIRKVGTRTWLGR